MTVKEAIKKITRRKKKGKKTTEQVMVTDREGTPICTCNCVMRFKGHRIELKKGVRVKHKQYYCPKCDRLMKIPMTR